MSAPSIPSVPGPPTPQTHPFIDVGSFGTYRDNWLRRDAAQTAEIERLKALIPAPAPAPKTRFGVNASDLRQHADHAGKFGPIVEAWRYFQQPGEPIAWPREFTLKPQEAFVYSGKVHPRQVTKEMFVNLFRAAPTDRPFYPCVWHEPTSELLAGQFTKAEFDQAFRLMRQAQQEVGDHIRISAIMEGWNWHSDRDPEAFLPPPETYDVLGVDVYFDGPIGPSVSKIPTQFDPMIATAQKFGKTWAAPELGIGTKIPGLARQDALTLLARTVREKGAEFACYFDNDDWTLGTPELLGAWKAGQVSSPAT